jgi:hypothetical protein
MKSLCASAVLFLLGSSWLRIAEAQSLPAYTLTDNQPVTLRGTLQLVHSGWNTFVILKTLHTYATRFDPPADAPAPVDQIQLVLDWQGAALAANAGALATVQGSVMLNPYSGYYLNGVAVLAEAVTLADGTVLHKGVAPQLSPPVSRYLATVILDPAAPTWLRSAIELPSGHPLHPRGLDGCSLNGAGDLLNCSCIEGFTATRAGRVSTTTTSAATTRLPRIDDGLAQIPLPDAALHPFTVQVLCTRQKATP